MANHTNETTLVQWYADCCSLRRDRNRTIGEITTTMNHDQMDSCKKQATLCKEMKQSLTKLVSVYKSFKLSNEKVIDDLHCKYRIQWKKFEKYGVSRMYQKLFYI